MLGSELGPDPYRVTGKRPRSAGLHLELPHPIILPEMLLNFHHVQQQEPNGNAASPLASVAVSPIPEAGERDAAVVVADP